MMKAWKTVSRTVLLQMGKWLTVERRSVELPDGRVIDDWAWLETPDYVNVVAVTEDGRFPIFRQVKYGVEGETLAPVGGYIEPGEDPLTAAKRELLEETGYVALEWKFLGRYRVDGNRGAGNGSFFLARGAYRMTEIDADDLEEQELLLLDREEVLAMLRKGSFKVMAWTANVAMALLELSDAN